MDKRKIPRTPESLPKGKTMEDYNKPIRGKGIKDANVSDEVKDFSSMLMDNAGVLITTLVPSTSNKFSFMSSIRKYLYLRGCSARLSELDGVVYGRLLED